MASSIGDSYCGLFSCPFRLSAAVFRRAGRSLWLRELCSEGRELDGADHDDGREQPREDHGRRRCSDGEGAHYAPRRVRGCVYRGASVRSQSSTGAPYSD